MGIWSVRSTGYKVGFFVLFLASVLLLAGLIAVTVLTLDLSYFKLEDEDWFAAFLALQAVGVVGAIVACVLALVVNCCLKAPKHNRALEIIIAITAAFSFAGSVVYVVKGVDLLRAEEELRWVISVDLAACVLLVLAAALLWVTNDPLSNKMRRLEQLRSSLRSVAEPRRDYSQSQSRAPQPYSQPYSISQGYPQGQGRAYSQSQAYLQGQSRAPFSRGQGRPISQSAMHFSRQGRSDMQRSQAFSVGPHPMFQSQMSGFAIPE